MQEIETATRQSPDGTSALDGMYATPPQCALITTPFNSIQDFVAQNLMCILNGRKQVRMVCIVQTWHQNLKK